MVHERVVVQHRVQRPGPVPGDLDQAYAGLLQPVGDPLGLLDAGGRQRVVFRSDGPINNALIDLKSIRLVPAKD